MLFILIPLKSCWNIHCILNPAFYIHKIQRKHLNQQCILLIQGIVLKVKQRKIKSGQCFTAVFWLELLVVEDYVDAHTYFCFSCLLAVLKNHSKPKCWYNNYSSKSKISSMYGNGCVYVTVWKKSKLCTDYETR